MHGFSFVKNCSPDLQHGIYVMLAESPAILRNRGQSQAEPAAELVHSSMQGLSAYGNGFLAKFEGASCPNKLLEEITLVDTPGVDTRMCYHMPIVHPLSD